QLLCRSLRARVRTPVDDHWCFRLRFLACLHFAQPDPLLSSWMSSSPAYTLQDFPVLADLASERPTGRLQVLKHRSPLLCASRDHCPDPFAPAVSLFTPCTLRDQTIDHHEPDRLLCQVVGRLHSRGRDESEITLPMLLEPLRQVATVVRRRHVVCAAS